VTVTGSKRGFAPSSATSATTALVTGVISERRSLTSAVPPATVRRHDAQRFVGPGQVTLVYSWNRNETRLPEQRHPPTPDRRGFAQAQAITVTVPGSELGFAGLREPAAVLADPLSRYPVVHLEGDLARAPPQAGEVDGDEGSKPGCRVRQRNRHPDAPSVRDRDVTRWRYRALDAPGGLLPPRSRRSKSSTRRAGAPERVRKSPRRVSRR
jgi:hypothetical protein